MFPSSASHAPSPLTANKACVAQRLVLLLLLATQVGERVDDDAKDEVQHDDDDHKEEQQVVHHTGKVERFLREGFLVTNEEADRN